MFAILLIIIFTLGVGLGFCALQIITSSKNKTISLLQDECNELEIILLRTKAEIQEHKQILQDKQNKIDHLENSISLLSNQRANLISSVEDLKEAAKRNADSLFEANIEVANAHFEMAAEKLCLENQELQKQYQNEYLQILNESTKAFEETISNYLQQKEELEKEIESLRSVVDAAVEASRRKLEEEEKENFYRLQLTETDRNEIIKLREVIPYIKNAEALNKVIWTIYYQKPYTDLVGRVFGEKKPCGIYKITNLDNQMTYVGQSVNVPERWRQHIKRGIGAEAPTRNKLYPAMLAIGVENFTFEFIEECDKSQLDQKEQYWQEYFHAKDFGYSIK